VLLLDEGRSPEAIQLLKASLQELDTDTFTG
jgi:hypothetical protein